MEDFEKLIAEKKLLDKKQWRINVLITFISIVIIVIIINLTTKTKNINETLTNKLDTAYVIKDSLARKLKDTLQIISKKYESDIIECFGFPTGKKTSTGLPMYNFTIRIFDSSILPTLKKVDYYFADDTYNPKLKTSDNAIKHFAININNSWGCMNIVPVYLHFTDNRVDTIFFPMCKKARLDLPKIQ